MAKYRYILCEICGPYNYISTFPLFSKQSIGECDQAIRITIPDEIPLTDIESCNMFVKQFNPMPMVRINGKWVKRPDLLYKMPYTWHAALHEEGYKRNSTGYYKIKGE